MATHRDNKMAAAAVILVALATLGIPKVTTGYAVMPTAKTNTNAADLQEKYTLNNNAHVKIKGSENAENNLYRIQVKLNALTDSIDYTNEVLPEQNKHVTVKKAMVAIDNARIREDKDNYQHKNKTSNISNLKTTKQMPRSRHKRSLNRLEMPESGDEGTGAPMSEAGSSTPSTEQKVRLCAYKYNTSAHAPKVSFETDNSGNYDDLEEQDLESAASAVVNISGVQMERCARQTDPCYALWTENQHGDINIIGQGCLESSEGFECGASACVWRPTSSPPKAKFCCCRGPRCNLQPSSSPPSSSPSSPVAPAPRPALVWLLPALCLLSASLLVLACCCCCSCYRNSNSKATLHDNGDLLGSAESGGGPGFSCSTTCVDNLKLHDNIGSGRVSVVWRGSLGSVPVAVKAVPAARKAAWAREKELYLLPHMQHSNLLHYLGCDTRWTLEGCLEHLLVLQLAPLGSLREHLTHHTLDWGAFTGMALGVASALAHLHTHIRKDGLYKPCIVHRDVNSSNIVVMADLTVCLGDLGLAMPLPDESNNRSTPSTQHKIQEAGTLRYLSPEALEGALDLRRCASALRAVDVYALALVLWELLARCAALHRPPGPPPYHKPYSSQLGGQEPDQERMRLLVARRKVRPLFSPLLLQERATRLTKDTIEDCWDHDAEARLTAVCVVERLTELRSLRPATSPNINTNDLRPPQQDGLAATPSPSGGDGKNSNLMADWAGGGASASCVGLQPHQDRNPCLERNLAPARPNLPLIDRSLKDLPPPAPPGPPPASTSPPHHDFSRTDMAASTNTRNTRTHSNQTSEHTHLHPDEHIFNELRPNRPGTPLGYVQNDVSEPGGGGAPPDKQTNIKQDNLNQRWSSRGLRRLLENKVFRRKHNHNLAPLETEVNLVLANGKPINNSHISSGGGKVKTSVIVNECSQELMLSRPCSLPGLEQANNLWNNTNNTCTVSPPNQTIAHPDNLVQGYKELPSNPQQLHNNSSPNRVFAVIVPKNNHSAPDPHKHNNNKRHSTDDKTLLANNKLQQHATRNSYSGETQGNFCHYNTTLNYNMDSGMDYSSNSEDEHMLLLSEEGGEKITMRQRQGANSLRRKTKPTNNLKYEALNKKLTQNEAISLHGSNLSLCKVTDDSYNILDLKNDSNSSVDNLATKPSSGSGSSVEVSGDNKPLVPLSIRHNLSRQHSLELVSCLFSSAGSLARLKDPALRIKTPGDVPPSVRRLRSLRNNNKHNNNRLSLYDDRMMFGNSL